EQHDVVARSGRLGELDVLVLEHAHAEGVDQRVAGVSRVEADLTADVGKPQAVAVGGDPGDNPGQHPLGVGGVGGPEPQRVHHGDRAGTHGEDVAHDTADTGRRPLVRLHVGGVVVRLDLEGDRVAVADVHHARVLADPDEQHVGVGRFLPELAEVNFGTLVGAVLAPHDRVDGQLGGGGTAAEDLPDPRVLL